jgi:hypothetical protein
MTRLLVAFRACAAFAILTVGGACAADELPDAAPDGCGAGQQAPITSSQLVEALGKHGISAVPSDNQTCAPFYLAKAVSNVPTDREVNENDIVDAEGLLDCVFLSERGLTAYGSRIETIDVDTVTDEPGKLRLTLANVDCVLYFDDSQQPRAQRLRMALNELERELEQGE